MNKFLVVGLGNPEDDYSGTRHNIGFDIVNHLSKSRNVVMSEDRYGFIGKFKIKPSNLIVIVDDLNLNFGKSRIRPSGKDGGHNGLKSITEKINTENFVRLRFGIGNNFQTGKQIDYVLGKWSSIEKNSLEDLINNNSEMILHIVKHGVENTMNKYN